MNAIQGLILGIVQGLTEFLPISSSGHLLVLQKIFGIDTDGQLLLNILLHLGTLVAVFAVYWRRIWNMLMHPIQSDLKWLVVATIPAVIAALVALVLASMGLVALVSSWIALRALNTADASALLKEGE